MDTKNCTYKEQIFHLLYLCLAVFPTFTPQIRPSEMETELGRRGLTIGGLVKVGIWPLNKSEYVVLVILWDNRLQQKSQVLSKHDYKVNPKHHSNFYHITVKDLVKSQL